MAVPNILSVSCGQLHLHSRDLEQLSVPALSSTAIATSTTSIAEASIDGSLHIRDAHSFHSIRLYASEAEPVTALKLSEEHLVSGHSDGTIIVQKVSSNDRVTFKEASKISDVALPKDERYLAAATASTIALFSTLSNRLITRLSQPQARSYPRITASQARFTSLAFSPIHTPLLAATDDTGCVTVYDIANILSSSRTHPLNLSTPISSATHARFSSVLRAPATALSFSQDGHLAVVGFDKLLRIFHPSLKQLLFTVSLPSPISSVAFSDTVAVGLADGSIALVTLDIPNSSGTISKRQFIETSPRSGSSAVKAIFFQPKPSKRKKPPRTDTSFSMVAENSAVDEFLSSIDQLDNNDDDFTGEAAADLDLDDAELFSPVSRRRTLQRLAESKAASFHTLEFNNRSKETPRSFSAQNLSPLKSREPPEAIGAEVASGSKGSGRNWEDVLTTPFRSGPRRRVATQEDTNDQLSRDRRKVTPSSASYESSFGASSTHDALSTRSTATNASSASSRREVKINTSERILPPPHPNAPASGRTPRLFQRASSHDSIPITPMGYAEKKHAHSETIPSRSTPIISSLKANRSSALRAAGAVPIEVLEEQKDSNTRIPLQPTTEESAILSMTTLSDGLKEVLRQELEVIRTDLRSDILNIHTEIITSAARQSQELLEVVKERDVIVRKLEDEVTQLRADNMRLRKKLGLL